MSDEKCFPTPYEYRSINVLFIRRSFSNLLALDCGIENLAELHLLVTTVASDCVGQRIAASDFFPEISSSADGKDLVLSLGRGLERDRGSDDLTLGTRDFSEH
jgi:hypothetical protein